MQKIFSYVNSNKTKQAMQLYAEGKMLITQKKLREAKYYFEQVIEIDPSCKGAHYQLAEISQTLNQ
jgi:Tfp pilus assembly protein PilF